MKNQMQAVASVVWGGIVSETEIVRTCDKFIV